MKAREVDPCVVFTGAGLSTASGIPDYRSAGGIWERFDPDEFTIGRFHADPASFWDRRARLLDEMGILDALPNAGHAAIAEAVRAGRVQHVVTQNVDGLHTKAGTPPGRLIELHGNSSRTRCMACGATEHVQATLARRRDGQAPRCACSGLLKPDVVLFGETVDGMPEAMHIVAAARKLIVAGTSLRVHPAAGLVDVALHAGAEVVICNGEPTPYDGRAETVRGDVVDTLAQLLSRLAQ